MCVHACVRECVLVLKSRISCVLTSFPTTNCLVEEYWIQSTYVTHTRYSTFQYKYTLPYTSMHTHILSELQLNRNIIFPYSNMTAENNVNHPTLVKCASRKSSKLLLFSEFYNAPSWPAFLLIPSVINPLSRLSQQICAHSLSHPHIPSFLLSCTLTLTLSHSHIANLLPTKTDTL